MIEDIFDAKVITYIKKEIDKANENEVFFVANIDEYGIIDEIKSFAKGNKHSVPVIFKQAYKGDCVIHNHPSGNLEPSTADIQIASKLANDGIGFIIIDNSMNNCNIIVGNVEENKITPLDSFELLKIISKKGSIAKNLEYYEERKCQETMLEVAVESFNNNNIGLIEAGTGTGKSLAYLIPSIVWAVTNKEKVVISTNTINLQEQLMKKDIPLLKKSLNIDFEPILVKGANNYICLKKLNKLLGNIQQLIINENDSVIINEIFDFANNKAKTGSKDELGFIPSSTLWEKINVETDLCTRAKCRYFSKCFFFKARKSAVKADLLIVNHHILCADISIRSEIDDFTTNALLPAYNKVIIDEAHNLEDVATDYFGNIITRIGLKRIISKLYSRNRGIVKGVLSLISFVLKQNVNKDEYQEEIISIIKEELIDIIKASVKQCNVFFDVLFNYVIELNSKDKDKTKFRLSKENLLENFENVKEQGKILSDYLLKISGKIKMISLKYKQMKHKDKESIFDEMKEVEALKNKIYNCAMIIEENLSLSDLDNKVYWIEIRNINNPNVINLSSCPLNVSDFLRESIFKYFDTIILTSATLTSNKKFDYLKNRIGLNGNLEKDLTEIQLESPFNYAEQMSICIPLDIVEPSSNKYLDLSSEYIKNIINVTHGSTFLLFTSFYALEYSFTKVVKHFGEKKFTFLKQGMYDRHTILTKFKNNTNSILFGTDSFWEGVDVLGDSLRCVVLMKLPFRVPTEPIIQARIEKMKRENINSFMEYIVPQTVIKFRQGFGRLIRSKNDTGCVVCLDRRIATKSYGKIFLQSLPPANRVISTKDSILSELKQYFY